MKKIVIRSPKISAREKLLLKAFLIASKVVNDSADDPHNPNNEKLQLLNLMLFKEFKMSIHDILYHILVGSNTKPTCSHLMDFLWGYYYDHFETEDCLKLLLKHAPRVKPLAYRPRRSQCP